MAPRASALKGQARCALSFSAASPCCTRAGDEGGCCLDCHGALAEVDGAARQCPRGSGALRAFPLGGVAVLPASSWPWGLRSLSPSALLPYVPVIITNYERAS